MSSISERAQVIAQEHINGEAEYPYRDLADAIEKALRDERERAAKIAETPYSDEVEAFAGDEPKAVGEKIARAIRKED